MKITDACVYPYPKGDSSVRRMALEAKDLGFDRLVAADTPPGGFYGIEIYSGILIRTLRYEISYAASNMREIIKQLFQFRPGITGSTGQLSILREFISSEASILQIRMRSITWRLKWQLITVLLSILTCRPSFRGGVLHASAPCTGTVISWCLSDGMSSQ